MELFFIEIISFLFFFINFDYCIKYFKFVSNINLYLYSYFVFFFNFTKNKFFLTSNFVVSNDINTQVNYSFIYLQRLLFSIAI